MRRWFRLIPVLIVFIALVWIVLSLGGGLVGLVKNADVNGSECDPMFAEEALIVTRPPEIYAEETQKPHKTLDDYVPEVETPVDKTADELILEARQAA